MLRDMTVSVSDRTEQLTRVQVNAFIMSGEAERLSRAHGLDSLAARCGVSAQELFGWFRGEGSPSTGQALAWMSACYGRAIGRLAASNVAARRPGAEQDWGVDVRYRCGDSGNCGRSFVVKFRSDAVPPATERCPMCGAKSPLETTEKAA